MPPASNRRIVRGGSQALDIRLIPQILPHLTFFNWRPRQGDGRQRVDRVRQRRQHGVAAVVDGGGQ